jgi:hypothetical protein
VPINRMPAPNIDWITAVTTTISIISNDIGFPYFGMLMLRIFKRGKLG